MTVTNRRRSASGKRVAAKDTATNGTHATNGATNGTVAKKAKPAQADNRQKDALDQMIDTITIPGTFGILVLLVSVVIQVYGVPDDLSLYICSVVMGMGRGGVPGRKLLSSLCGKKILGRGASVGRSRKTQVAQRWLPRFSCCWHRQARWARCWR